MTQHQGACSTGGSGGVSRHGCCVQARDKICDPAPRGVLEGGVLGGFPGTAAVSKHETKSVTQHQGACSRGRLGGSPPPRHGCCVQARDKICDPAPGGVLEGRCPEGVSLPGTAAVSKHETGTLTKQATGALQFMVAFALRGEGGQHLRKYISLRCALGVGTSVPEAARL